MSTPTIATGDKIAYDVKGAAEAVSMSPSYIHIELKANRLPAHRAGRSIVIHRDDLDEWVRNLPPY